MRILYIDQYAGGPSLGMEFRTQYLAREWQAMGHEVRVVTATFSHLRQRQLAAGAGEVDGMAFLAVRTPRYPANGPRRFLNIVAFHMGLRRMQRRLAQWGPDVVIAASTHPLDVRPAVNIARRSSAAMIYEVRDLWPLTPLLLSDMGRRHPMIMWMQREEDYGYRMCDMAVSLLPLTEPYMRSRGLAADKWHYLPNGVSAPTVVEPGAMAKRNIERMRSLRSHYPIVVVYAGSQGPANALDRLLRHADEASKSGIGIVLVGDGPDSQVLRQRYGHAPNLLFLPRVPRAEIPAILGAADVGYAGLAPSPLYEYGIGMNKVWDYMAAGLPILEHIDSPHSPVRDARCGWRADPARPEALAGAFHQIAATPTHERRRLGQCGKDFVLSRYTEELIAREYLELMARARRRDGRTLDAGGSGVPARRIPPSAAAPP